MTFLCMIALRNKTLDFHFFFHRSAMEMAVTFKKDDFATLVM